MTDQKPTGVFVRLPLSDDQKRLVVAEMMFAGDPVADSFVSALRAIGTPVQGKALPILAKRYDCPENTRVNAIETGPLPFADEVETNLCDADTAQAEIVAMEAYVVRLRSCLEGMLPRASVACNRSLSGRDSRLLAGYCAEARELLKGGKA